MRLPYELHLALRYLRFHRGRTFLSFITLISVAGVAVGTAALVIALSLAAGFAADVRARIHSGSAHLTVMSAEQADEFTGADALVARLEADPEIEAASPVIYTPALVTFEGMATHGFVELHGIEPGGHARVVVGDDATESVFSRLSRPAPGGKAGILLGEQLAARIGALEGDLVRVMVPKILLTPWRPLPRTRVYEVVGRYRSDHFQEDATRAYIGLNEARSLIRAPERSSWVEVRLNELPRLERVKQRLRGELSPAWLVVDLIEQNQDLLKALNTEKLILFLAIGLIVVVAALNIVSTLILMVTDKIKEIGTLTAMGARPSGIAGVFMLQGIVIGVVGTALGVMLGVAASWWLDRYEIIRLDPDVYYLTHIPFVTQPLDLVIVGATVLGVSFVATLYPAFKAARLDPVEALRYE